MKLADVIRKLLEIEEAESNNFTALSGEVERVTIEFEDDIELVIKSKGAK